MTAPDIAFLVVCVVLLVAVAKPLGLYMAAVYEGRRTWLHPVLGPVERGIYRLSGIKSDAEQTWKKYLVAVLLSNLLGFLLLYGILRFQGHLPLNPQGLPAVK